jgi:peptidoglycan/xylan/chitin deacetylase (PgdA/CDA1 family)
MISKRNIINSNHNRTKSERIDLELELLKMNTELWDLFARKEEYEANLLDNIGRFPYYLSKNRNIFSPDVSEYLINKNFEIEYPEKRKFAICLTHDIDKVLYPNIDIITGIAGSLYRRRLRDALKVPFYNLHKKWNPKLNFEKIMAIEEKFNAKSSFFFMGLEEGDQDYNYLAKDLSHEMGCIVDRGWEVGLHGGNEAFNKLETIKREKDRLEKELGRRVIGYRNHFLRFRVPITWELLKEADFKYDSTFGYADCIGYRNGMCHPFKPFNLNTITEIDILEIPLNIMDTTLYDAYMRLDSDSTWAFVKQLIDTTEKHNGVLTILWHNTSMISDKLRLYKKILDYCFNKGAWMTSGEEIYEFWNKNY